MDSKILPVETTRRTASGRSILAIIQMPDGHRAEQLPGEIAKELTGNGIAFAITGPKAQSAAKGDATGDLAAIIAAEVAKALAAAKR